MVRLGSAIKAAVKAMSIMVLCLPAALPGVSAQAANEVPSADGSGHRINVAGRQRMLSQKMTKAVCMALSGSNAAMWREEAYSAAVTFESSLADLIFGSADGRIAASRDPQVTAALREVADISAGLTRSVKQLAHGDVNSFAMSLVLTRNLPTLEKMHQAVGLIEGVEGRGNADPLFASTINQAGRQRMLSQKIAKDLCLLSSGLADKGVPGSLRENVELFSATLHGLQHGSTARNLLAAPTAPIRAHLATVQKHWRSIAPVLLAMSDGGTISPATLSEVMAETETILVEMNAAVGLWAASQD